MKNNDIIKNMVDYNKSVLALSLDHLKLLQENGRKIVDRLVESSPVPDEGKESLTKWLDTVDETVVMVRETALKSHDAIVESFGQA